MLKKGIIAVVNEKPNTDVAKPHPYDKYIQGTTLFLSGKDVESKHKYTDKHIAAIVSFVRNRPQVKIVDLSHNKITALGIKYYTHRIKSSLVDFTGNYSAPNESVLSQFASVAIPAIPTVSVTKAPSLFNRPQRPARQQPTQAPKRKLRVW